MKSIFKTIFIFFLVLCCLQFVLASRFRRDSTTGKGNKNDLDVNALSQMIMTRLKDNVKDGSDSVKNIVNTANNRLQNNPGMQIRVN